jgi:hypothetical protein
VRAERRSNVGRDQKATRRVRIRARLVVDAALTVRREPDSRQRQRRVVRIGGGDQRHFRRLVGRVEKQRWRIVARRREQHVEERHSALVQVRPYALRLAVAQKRAKERRVHMRAQIHQERLVELERLWKLQHELPAAVEELQKDGRALRVLVIAHVVGVAVTLAKLVAKRKPLFRNQHTETLDRAVVRLHHDLRQRRHLRRAVPAVGAVQQHRRAVALNRAHNAIRRVQNASHVAEPARRRHVAVELRLVAFVDVHAAQLARARHLGEALAHHVNVFDVAKFELAAVVALVAAALEPIGVGVHFRPRIHDAQRRRVGRIRQTHGVEHHFVLLAARAPQTDERLRAARNRGARLVVHVHARWHTMARAKRAHFSQRVVVDGRRHDELARIGVAELELVVQLGAAPACAIDASAARRSATVGLVVFVEHRRGGGSSGLGRRLARLARGRGGGGRTRGGGGAKSIEHMSIAIFANSDRVGRQGGSGHESEASDLEQLVVQRPGRQRDSASVVNRKSFAILTQSGSGKVKGKEHFKVVRKRGAVQCLSHGATCVLDAFFRIVKSIRSKKFCLNF